MDTDRALIPCQASRSQLNQNSGPFHIHLGRVPWRPELEVARFLKIRSRESRFLLPVGEMRNWESENDSLSIPFMNPLTPTLVSIPAKICQGTGIAILRNRNLATSTPPPHSTPPFPVLLPGTQPYLPSLPCSVCKV